MHRFHEDRAGVVLLNPGLRLIRPQVSITGGGVFCNFNR
jgi:hypothetical protein